MTAINTSNALGAKVIKFFPLNGTEAEIVGGNSSFTLGDNGSIVNDPTYGPVLQGNGAGAAARLTGIDLSGRSIITLAFRTRRTIGSMLIQHGGDVRSGSFTHLNDFALYGQDPTSANTMNFITNHGGAISGSYWDYLYRNIPNDAWAYHIVQIDNRGEGVPHGRWVVNGEALNLNGGFGNAATGFTAGPLDLLMDGAGAQMHNLAIFEGALTEAEEASLTANPDQILQAAVVASRPGDVLITDAIKQGTNSNTYNIVYNQPAANGADVDFIEFNLSPATEQGVNQIFDVTIDGAKLINLLPNTAYMITARAHNSAGYGLMSDVYAFVTQADSSVPVNDGTTVPNAPSNVVATAGDGTVTVSFNLPSSTGGKPILDYTVIGSDNSSKTQAAGPFTMAAANGVQVSYQVLARNANGASQLSSPSNLVTPQPAGAQAKPVVPGYTVKVYGDEPGDDFTTPAQVAAWTGSQSTLPKDQGPFIVFCRKTLDLSGQQFGPGWSEPANVGYFRPYPGMSREELAPNGPKDITVNTPGVKLIMSSDARIKVGLFLEGFNIIQTGGRLIFRRDGWGQGGTDCGWRNCRMLSTSAVSAVQSGEYGNGYVSEDNLIIQDSASTAGVMDTFSGTVLRNTIVRRGAGAGNPAFTGNGVFARDNNFSGCGGTPITAPGGGDHNYTDTPLTNNENGKITYSPGQFFESATDLRPAAGSLMINGASQYAISTSDASGSNRGTRPDAGAFQRDAAMPLATGTITVQRVDGASYIFSATTVNNPTSGKITLSPGSVPNGAQTIGPVDLVLTPGQADLEIDFIPPGSYNVTATLTNDGGTKVMFGTAPFEIAGVGKLAYDTGGLGDAVTPVDPPVEPEPIPVPTVTILSTADGIMSGKEATLNATVDFHGATGGTVVVTAEPTNGGAALLLGNATLTGTNAVKKADLAKGEYKLKITASAGGQTTTAYTGVFRVLGLVGSFVLPAA